MSEEGKKAQGKSLHRTELSFLSPVLILLACVPRKVSYNISLSRRAHSLPDLLTITPSLLQ